MSCNLYFGDAYLILEPTIPSTVTKYLTYWHRSIEKGDDDTGKKKGVGGETRKLYIIEQRVSRVTQQLSPHLITLPGFAYKIKTLVEEAGIPVNFIDERSSLPAIDITAALSKLRDYQKPAVYTMVNSYGGILCCPTGYGKTFAMAGVICAFTRDELTARGTPLTVVVTPGTDLAEKNAEALAKILEDREVGIVCTGNRKFSDDIQVVTPESIPNLDMTKCGLLLYDECHTLSSSRADLVMLASKAIRYGFSATPTGRFDGADLVTEGCFGPVVYRRTYQQAVADGAIVPINVVWIPTAEPRSWKSFATRDGAYRNALWCNKEFHLLAKAIFEHIPLDMQAIAVVDKLSHMDNFLQLMPELTYSHGSVTAKALEGIKPKVLKPVPKERRAKVRKMLETGECMRAIASGIYRTGVDFPKLSVMINLAGMKSSIINTQLPGRTGRSVEGKEEAYLIDFWHGWDVSQTAEGEVKTGFLLSDCKARQKVYESLGFNQYSVYDLTQMFKGGCT